MRKSREALLVRVTPDTTKTLCECLGVTVFATGADLGAAAHRIPSGISPLDVRAITHLAASRVRTLSCCRHENATLKRE